MRQTFESILSRVCITPHCWNWMGTVTDNGYGMVSLDGKSNLVHRLFFTRLVGPIPEGLHIDHLCGNRKCVNPDHLEAVTTLENNRRSECLSTINARKTHCHKGHELTKENVYRPPGAMNRHCRICKAERQRIARAKEIL